MSVEVKYNSKTLATVEEGYTAVVECKDKKMVDNIEVVNTTEVYDGSVSVSSALISFTINETSYQVEDGMTWNDLVDSDYNTANVWKGTITVDSQIIIEVSGNNQIVQLNGVDVKANEVIVDNASYTSRATTAAD